MFIGRNMTWFFGVVEDRFDPLFMGRVRVRVMGIHTEQKSKDDKKGIPTEELLWMHPGHPITSAAMSGIGYTPLGLVEGSHVYGFFRDPFCQDGIVIGSLGGNYDYKPDRTKGFADPTGAYPRYYGNDLNVLAGGGQESGGSVSSGAKTTNGVPDDIVMQNDNTGVAVNPNDAPLEDVPEDDNPDFTIEDMLRGDEGYRTRTYWDSEGYPTIGIGHLILHQKTKNMTVINAELSRLTGREVTDGSITAEEVSSIFADDIAKMKADIIRNSTVGPVYQTLNASRRMAIENMCFQMGVGGVAKFTNTLEAMMNQEWQEAYNHLLNSTWARQTPGRSQRVSKIVLTGNLESYGVIAPEPEPPEPPELLRYALAVENDDSSPEEPSTPEDTRIMFEEPPSSYNAAYPYNHVYETESGHVQEFDDTPGYERYRRKHPSMTYEEIQPNGNRVVKIVGEDYLIVNNGRNLNVKGNMKIVVEGNARVYYMGDVHQTIDGSVDQFVRGNVNESIEGDVTQKIKGNAIQNIKGDANQTIEGNVVQNITGNVDQTITGNLISQAAMIKFMSKGDFIVQADGNVDISGSNTVLMADMTAQISGSTININ